jgi:CheY-like chemotaxis protein
MKTEERYRVLYVDDDQKLLELCSAFSGRYPDLTVLTASSPEEGFKMLHSERVDVIISDNDMPGVTGIEFLKQVRADKNFEGIPFILFTGKDREEIVIEALKNKADFYIQKGGDPNSQYAELFSMAGAAYKKRRFEKMILKVYDFSIGVVNNNDLKINIEILLSSIVDIFHVSASHVSLIEDGEFLHHFASVGEISEELKNVRLPDDYGLGWMVIKGGNPYAINNYKETGFEYPKDDVSVRDGIMTYAAAPIKHSGKTWGVLYVHRYFEKKFSPKDLRTLSFYANLVGIALKMDQESKEDESVELPNYR